MPLNKVKPNSNMYKFCTHTWSPIRGRCSHLCSYCSTEDQKFRPVIASKYDGDPLLVAKEMKTNLGKNNIIFVQNMSDLFADNVDKNTVYAVLEHCLSYPDNTYLFQSKNPARFLEFEPTLGKLKSVILATTIETDEYPRDVVISKAPSPSDRADAMARLTSFKRMVTIEPIIAFNMQNVISLIQISGADIVTIGGDSKGHSLPEPSKEEVILLISALRGLGKEVRIKSNLERITGALQ